MNRLLGLVFTAVVQSGEDSIRFFQGEKACFELTHVQDCCEHVYIESIVGDLTDLQDSPILVSEESSSDDPNADESGTWTFYKLATRKGYVDIRFYGSSNGYYGESACLIELDENGHHNYNW